MCDRSAQPGPRRIPVQVRGTESYLTGRIQSYAQRTVCSAADQKTQGVKLTLPRRIQVILLLEV